MANHNDNAANKPYEQNLIGLRGIVFFGIGLFLLIVVTFALMYAMQNVLEENAVAMDEERKQPLALQGEERLPPEPRLQAAPGFKVEGPNGPVNLELTIPQAEYRELEKQWNEILKNGQKVRDKDGKDVVLIAPIEEGKAKFLEQIAQKPVSRQGELTEKAVEDASTYYSYASAGRLKVDKRK
jgi:hypothetical protein